MDYIDFAVKKGGDMPLGVSLQNGYIQFAVSLPGEETCTLCLYEAGAKEPAARLPMPQVSYGIFSLLVKIPKKGKNSRTEYEYLYETKNGELCDSYAMQITGRAAFGEEPEQVRGAVLVPAKNETEYARHALEELILYKLHVRGYTMSETSGVKKNGTFAGLTERIPYLKTLGINGVLLLPVVDFDELEEEHKRQSGKVFGMPERTYHGQKTKETDGESEKAKKLNFWGYHAENTFYFAPKASYAANPEHVTEEFQTMVNAFHKAGIDVYLEMMFDGNCTQAQMLDCLRCWVRTYGVDGFHINDSILPATLVAGDAYLQNTAFFVGSVSGELKQKYPGRFAEYRDSFCTDMRRYLKGDEGLVPALYHYFKNRQPDAGRIHYMADHNGFTLRDLYSYDVRHNEANGENGRDGTEYNFSWNCGEEGVTKKQRVEALRLKMMKNALTTLLLSGGIPMLLGGDEFARTKDGNNNSYCHDNEISWLDWTLLKKNRELLEYTKTLIALRKEHPVFYGQRELYETDFLSCGYPEISLHGIAPWQVDTSGYNRLADILFCGNYLRRPDKTFEDHFCLLFNMHWEPHTFELPMEEEADWQVMLETESKKTVKAKKKKVVQEEPFKEQETAEKGVAFTLAPRSIVVLCAKAEKRGKGDKK